MNLKTRILLNQIGFGLIGFSNVFIGYTLISATFDLLSTLSDNPTNPPTEIAVDNKTTTITHSNPFCNASSTSVLALFSAVPCLIVRTIYPLYLINLPPRIKISAVVIMDIIAIISLSSFKISELILTGYVLQSMATILGDSTFASISPKYHKLSFYAYAVGIATGACTSTFSYAFLRMYMSIESVMHILYLMPIILTISYAFIIKPIDPLTTWENENIRLLGDHIGLPLCNKNRNGIVCERLNNFVESDRIKTIEKQDIKTMSLKTKLKIIKPAFGYFLPFSLTYLCTYYSNQGLYELINLAVLPIGINHAAQYRWYQFIFQVGELLGRSSINFVSINKLWFFPISQFITSIILLMQAFLIFKIPGFGFALGFILMQGIVSGSCYVNVLTKTTTDFKGDNEELVISFVCSADTSNIILAYLLAIPTHTAVCALY